MELWLERGEQTQKKYEQLQLVNFEYDLQWNVDGVLCANASPKFQGISLFLLFIVFYVRNIVESCVTSTL